MKKLLLLATGGTIASVATHSGLAPSLSGEELLANVPLVRELCNFDFMQIMNIDSTNMRPQNWLQIKNAIIEAYDSYDGFIILHGTDTMAYTAAALSYLIQESKKPIVLTGSQQPMANPFTDAKLNLYHSVLYALDNQSCGVVVVFGNEVIAGTRAHKQRTLSFNAFTSMNYPPLAYIRGNKIIRSAPSNEHADSSLKTYASLNTRVIVLKLTPELNPSILYLLKNDYDAVILETFGIGGIPSYDGAFEDAISNWIAADGTVVITTQVPEEGLDLGVYEVGRTYQDMPGVLLGDDMTTEALVAKTMWILGQTTNQEERKQLFYQVIGNDRIPQGANLSARPPKCPSHTVSE